jgi:hypothetical protein
MPACRGLARVLDGDGLGVVDGGDGGAQRVVAMVAAFIRLLPAGCRNHPVEGHALG